jgi:dTDP-4-amino-4,6-dideoxygalactose transaminase
MTVSSQPAATAIRFPIIRSAIPRPDAWLEFIDVAYRSGRFSNFGLLCRQLEDELVARWGTQGETCVLASSGTAAITAALIATGVEGNVLVPAFTFPASLAAIRMAHARPLVIDVDQHDWRVSPTALDDAFARTSARAAVVVNPFGSMHDFSAHAHVASRHNAVLVIDNAAGLGVKRTAYNRDAATFEAYSLHATKPFGIGEGGAIFAPCDFDERLRKALNFGLPDPNTKPNWGINGKLSELHAAVGLAVARGFNDALRTRQQLAARYIDVASRFPVLSFCRQSSSSSWQLFPMLFPCPQTANCFAQACATLGMETRRYYAPSLSVIPECEVLEPCPVSESLSQRMCCAPVYSHVDQMELVELPRILESALQQAVGTKV